MLQQFDKLLRFIPPASQNTGISLHLVYTAQVIRARRVRMRPITVGDALLSPRANPAPPGGAAAFYTFRVSQPRRVAGFFVPESAPHTAGLPMPDVSRASPSVKGFSQ